MRSAKCEKALTKSIVNAFCIEYTAKGGQVFKIGNLVKSVKYVFRRKHKWMTAA